MKHTTKKNKDNKNPDMVVQRKIPVKDNEHMIATYQGCVEGKLEKKRIVNKLTAAAEVVL